MHLKYMKIIEVQCLGANLSLVKKETAKRLRIFNDTKTFSLRPIMSAEIDK
jgi:hypothetical protein